MSNAAGRRGKLVVVSGPSGVGKSTIDREAVARTNARFSVSATTRQPRPGEVDGKDYHFVNAAMFQSMIDRDQLLEWAEVFGNCYGTPVEPVQAAIADGQVILLEIDVQGGLQVARKMPEATFVLVEPPDLETLEQRLRGRGTEDEETVRRRFEAARQELATAQDSGVYTHRIVNNKLDAAIADLVRIIEDESNPAAGGR